MRTDFENLEDGDTIILIPNESNPLHKLPITALYCDGYFYCHGSLPENGPDYYLGDVLRYNDGFEDLREP